MGSPVSDRAAVGRLKLHVVVGVVHWSDESTSFSKGSMQRRVITVQKWTTRTTCLAQERQDNSEKFTPRCEQFPSFSTSAAKTTLSWPHTASSSTCSKLKPPALFFLEADSITFCRDGKYVPVRLVFPRSSKLACGRMLNKKPMHQREKKNINFYNFHYLLDWFVTVSSPRGGRTHEKQCVQAPPHPTCFARDSGSNSHSLCCRIHASLADFFFVLAGSLLAGYTLTHIILTVINASAAVTLLEQRPE